MGKGDRHAGEDYVFWVGERGADGVMVSQMAIGVEIAFVFEDAECAEAWF